MTNKTRHIGDSIKMLRILAGYNQAQLAEEIGKTRGMISHIENSGKVNYYTLQSIARALRTSVEFIENYHLGAGKTPYDTSESEPSYGNKNTEALEKEITLLKEMIEYQRKVISLLENKLEIKG